MEEEAKPFKHKQEPMMPLGNLIDLEEVSIPSEPSPIKDQRIENNSKG
jgi:hypothetical protein